MKMFQLFKTLEERKKWIDEKKSDKDFALCYRSTVKQLAKDTYLSKEQIATYKYAVVYKYAD